MKLSKSEDLSSKSLPELKEQKSLNRAFSLLYPTLAIGGIAFSAFGIDAFNDAATDTYTSATPDSVLIETLTKKELADQLDLQADRLRQKIQSGNINNDSLIISLDFQKARKQVAAEFDKRKDKYVSHRQLENTLINVMNYGLTGAGLALAAIGLCGSAAIYREDKRLTKEIESRQPSIDNTPKP